MGKGKYYENRRGIEQWEDIRKTEKPASQHYMDLPSVTSIYWAILILISKK